MNCKIEFLKEIEDKQVLCAQVIRRVFNYETCNDEYEIFNLPINFTKAELLDFLDNISFEYDSEYGGQNIFGYIWYINGTWSKREEYDGSEWWTFKSVPPVPEELLC